MKNRFSFDIGPKAEPNSSRVNKLLYTNTYISSQYSLLYFMSCIYFKSNSIDYLKEYCHKRRKMIHHQVLSSSFAKMLSRPSSSLVGFKLLRFRNWMYFILAWRLFDQRAFHKSEWSKEFWPNEFEKLSMTLNLFNKRYRNGPKCINRFYMG